MPLFQPSNITPSTFAGVGGGTIDVNDIVNITWQVNGNVAMTAFKIDFYLGNSLVYTTNTVSLQEPFYPTDNKGNPNFYSYNANGATWSSFGFVNGKTYTMNIIQYWGGSTESAYSVEQFSQAVFITRTKPTLTITDVSGTELPSTVSSASKEVTASYYQEQGDSVDWVRWELYRVENGENVLMDDTGTINTALFLYTMENLSNENTYLVVCTLQTSSGVSVSTEKTIAALYSMPATSGTYLVNTKDYASNILEWATYENPEESIMGTSSTSPVTFENNSAVLDAGEWINWSTVGSNPMQISPTYSLAVETKTTIKATLEKNVLSTTAGKYVAVSSTGTVVSGREIFRNGEKVGEIDFTGFEIDGVEYGEEVVVDVHDGKFFIGERKISSSTWREFEYLIACVETTLGIYVACLFDVDTDATSITFRATIEETTTINRTAPFSVAVTDGWNHYVNGAVTAKEYVLWCLSGIKTVIGYTRFMLGGQVAGAYTIPLPNETDYFCSKKVDSIVSGNKDLIVVGGDTQGGRRVMQAGRSYNSNYDKYIYTMLYWDKTEGIYNDVSYEDEGCAAIKYDNESPICVSNYHIWWANSTNSRSDIFTEIKNDGSYVVDAEFSEDGTYLYGLSKSGYIYVYQVGEKPYIYYYVTRFMATTGNMFLFKNEADLFIANNKIFTKIIPSTTYTELFNAKTQTEVGFSVYTSEFSVFVSYENTIIEKRAFENEFSVLDVVLQKIENKTTYIKAGMDGSNIYLQLDNGEVLSATYSETQNAITSVEISNEQICDYVYIYNGSTLDIANVIPKWEETTIFLTNFPKRTFEAGRIGLDDTQTELYRINTETNEMKKVFTATSSVSTLRDFSWINNEKYNYTSFVRVGGKQIGEGKFTPTRIQKRMVHYALIEARQDESDSNVFHVLNYWLFGNNIQNATISNNNTPMFLSNFTGYRLKQPTAIKGRTGNLTALVSNAKNGTYSDTKTQIEELNALSQSENTFFVKDIKGNIYMVAISAPITYTVNEKTKEMETTISIPWEEIGDASNVSIIQTPLDENWGEKHRN